MIVTSRGISFQSSSNNTTSSPPYCVGIKRKSAPENIYNEELTAGIRDDYYYYSFSVYDDLNMGDMILLWIYFGKRIWK